MIEARLAAAPAMHDGQLPSLQLQCGRQVEGLRLRYQVHGALNGARDNAILVPTWFAGRHDAAAWLAGPGAALDTDRFCVIVANALGNGESSSASNHPSLSEAGMPLPLTLLDQVQAQRALLDGLGIGRLHAVLGRSMGAQMALQWGCMFPERVSRLVAFCGGPKTAPHNGVILDGLAEILVQGLRDDDHPGSLARASSVYAAWSASPTFFAEELWRSSAASLDQWLVRTLGSAFARFHPADLLSLTRCWQHADISANECFGGRLDAALAAIRAPTLMIAIDSDMLFSLADIDAAARKIPHAQMVTLKSAWGHRAAAPGGAMEDIQRLSTIVAGFVDLAPIDESWGHLWPF